METAAKKLELEWHLVNWATFGMTEHSAVHLHCESNPYLRYCILAFYEDRDSTAGGCTPQMAEKNPKHIVEGYGP